MLMSIATASFWFTVQPGRLDAILPTMALMCVKGIITLNIDADLFLQSVFTLTKHCTKCMLQNTIQDFSGIHSTLIQSDMLY